MAETTEITVPAGDWTQLSDGEPNVLIQIKIDDLIVCVAQAEPDGASRVGHLLGVNARSISFGSLAETDQVWAFSTGIEQKVTVTK